MRKTMKGIGMTARGITYHETPEEIKAWFKATAAAQGAAGNSFELTIAGIEEWACEQLADLGFKDANAIRERSHVSGGDSLPGRVGDYAARVLRYIQIVRKAIADNNAQEAARFGVTIGELFARIQATVEWEKFALRGKKIAESKRGLSRLYRFAMEIRKKRGANTPAKKVYKELESRGEIVGGKPTLKAFSTQLSRLQNKIR